MTLRPLPTSAVARFRTDVDRLLARALGEGELTQDVRLALAVSGGADSMAMLRLAAAAFPGGVIAATVDHQLRAAAAAEAASVARTCAELGIAHQTLRPLAPITGNSVQRRAREARYAALAEWARREGVAILLTAHHADDQAETLLMRLQRASGLAGLSAIRAIRFDACGAVIRPLLGWQRSELRTLVKDSETPFVDDPSNADPRHDRTKVRALLADTPALKPAALAASAAFLAEAEEVVAQAADTLWSHCWHGHDRPFAVATAPRELRRRLLRRALTESRAQLGVASPLFDDSTNVEALLDALAAGRGATQAGILVRPTRTGWLFLAAPPRRSL
ncbi:tRNA lysidine(34) synthetase TilS [Sphingomonas phyllosphaerae]|uniref:tRNA lysidine(34) synthetase TilS n=1 Tax=Sphingomonas phyllosphaerae TaxID=257003 RepID=UPI0003B51753|nr:tRNA lysidine(34) synthetase TilS [Sphingomonas phyllosphaerae]